MCVYDVNSCTYCYNCSLCAYELPHAHLDSTIMLSMYMYHLEMPRVISYVFAIVA